MNNLASRFLVCYSGQQFQERRNAPFKKKASSASHSSGRSRLAVGDRCMSSRRHQTLRDPRFWHRHFEHPGLRLRADEIRFFSYHSDPASEIRFLLTRDSDGHAHGAPDVCQRCHAYRHGFRSSGRYLICRVCGNRCKLDAVTTGIASCAPVNLRYQSTGKTVQIQTSDLKGATAFSRALISNEARDVQPLSSECQQA
jgi:hypothetical protein